MDANGEREIMAPSSQRAVGESWLARARNAGFVETAQDLAPVAATRLAARSRGSWTPEPVWLERLGSPSGSRRPGERGVPAA